MKKLVFFLGKGGVGKTTLSSAMAWQLGRSGKKILIASIDPAHNLGDVFSKTLSNSPKLITANIDAMEIDISAWVLKYLKDCKDEIKANYSYHAVMNLDSYTNILKYSPGTEEYAVIWAIEYIYKEYSPCYDIIILDTPPTALTLRFLAMPSISKIWIKELSNMRKNILEQRQTILKLNPDAAIIKGTCSKQDDPVYQKLSSISNRLSDMHCIFTEKSYLTVIVNPDTLSVTEAVRIREELGKLGLHIDSICLNKRKKGDTSETAAEKEFSGFPVSSYELLPDGLETVDDLSRINMDWIKNDILKKFSLEQ